MSFTTDEEPSQRSLKGIGPATGKKHELITQLAMMQIARALVFLQPGDRALIVDMHAGDAVGAKAIQPDLFNGDESIATPLIAIDVAARLRRHGIECDVLLCERSRVGRAALMRRGMKVLGNHRLLLSWQTEWGKYAFGLVFNDPNGPSRHGDEVLLFLARNIRRCDFIINVNEGSLQRLAGVRDDQIPGSFAASVAASRGTHLWRLNPKEWGRRLGRKFVLRSRTVVGNTAMKGRLLLVTNAPPARCPRNFVQEVCDE